MTAYYGFGDAPSGGFVSTVERLGGLYGRFSLWGKDSEEQSSNYQELCNLVETVEEKVNRGSSLKLLHELVLQLRKAKLEHEFTLHVVCTAGTRMIAWMDCPGEIFSGRGHAGRRHANLC